MQNACFRRILKLHTMQQPCTKAAKSKATKAKSPKKDVSPAKTARAKRSAKKQ